MKIFIGNDINCGLNYQYTYIYNKLLENFQITDNVKEADKIIFVSTCSCTKFHILYTLNYISSVLKDKKEKAEVYLTGCLTREFIDNPELNTYKKWLNKHIDYIIPNTKPNMLLKLISKDFYGDLDENDFGFVYGDGKTAVMYLATGCQNNCSFCKVSFQKMPLKSADINEVKEYIDIIDEQNYSELILKATNICQYGLDLYNDYMLKELIKYLEDKKNIKSVSLSGFSFKDAIKNDFEKYIRESSKVIELCGSLESGSDRILNLIRKGFTSDEIIEFVTNIRKYQYKKLYLNIISGFPTENIEDVKRTLDVLEQLDPYRVDINRYTNSPFINSNSFPQLSPEKIEEHTRIYSKVLKKRGKIIKINGEGYVYN